MIVMIFLDINRNTLARDVEYVLLEKIGRAKAGQVLKLVSQHEDLVAFRGKIESEFTPEEFWDTVFVRFDINFPEGSKGIDTGQLEYLVPVLPVLLKVQRGLE